MEARFLTQYFSHPRTVGAIMPSSKRLAAKMVNDINFDKINCIVEYGAGTGVFTEEILKRKNKNTKFIVIEYNKEFYEILKSKYNEENLFIINDSAENIDLYLKKYDINKVEAVVSGLPFASLPKSMSEKILRRTRKILGDEGIFITFQYSKMKKELLNRYFSNINWRKENLNIPPAYVLSCNNK
ncbi:methyltransferase domain-containing protein [Clostridium sp. NSJ-145]|uniref:class I SAM-dependent methyltransferase n=1 Tax=Clostridium sp. NSJ-145 TaxID=2897777 RepID=UPI001E54445A|nr:rRNA adenine N-6-methyltransferase family protein [Clostridium sp. NSJ-145]MCD2501968.1 methyltransferase domain-containing protein [Clostridium sp. NSJ-145]